MLAVFIRDRETRHKYLVALVEMKPEYVNKNKISISSRKMIERVILKKKTTSRRISQDWGLHFEWLCNKLNETPLSYQAVAVGGDAAVKAYCAGLIREKIAEMGALSG